MRHSESESFTKEAINTTSGLGRLSIHWTLSLMLGNHFPFLKIRTINLHTPKLGLNLANPVFLFMRSSIAESEIHIL